MIKKKEFWRTIILFGKNTATYKIALGKCLSNYAEQEKTIIQMDELAKDFFELYLRRLKNGKPQLSTPGRKTVVERAIELYKIGNITREQAIDNIEKKGFDDVIHRFHIIDKDDLPIQFYEKTDSGLIITDHLFEVFLEDVGVRESINQELSSRWDLLEAAFEMKNNNSQLINDIRFFYLKKGTDRSNITGLRPVLNGYQNDICFYCGEKMTEKVHVDHVIPWQFYRRDDVWNLVLAHSYCNEQKNDNLPAKHYIDKLIQRNEYFIASDHPIKDKLIQQLGKTPMQRLKKVWKVYDDALQVLPLWGGVSGYNLETDQSFKVYIQILTNRFNQ